MQYGTVVTLVKMFGLFCPKDALFHALWFERNLKYASPSLISSKHLHASILPAGDIIRTISRSREVRRAILIPRELLRANSPLAPPAHVVLHTMVHDPVLASIRTCSEASVTHAVSLFRRVLVEDAAFVVLLPVARVHWVLADQFELAEAVVTVVTASG